MFNEQVVVAVTPFSGTTSSDKNGENPVMLQCIAGKMPNRNVISGTVAQRIGVTVGHTYLMQVREQGMDKQFGLDFTFIKIKELTTGKDIIETSKELGEPQIVTIARPEGYENTYERKSVAVEGLRARRMREGNYIPSIQTTIANHETAPEIQRGSSQDSADRAEKILKDKEDTKNALN